MDSLLLFSMSPAFPAAHPETVTEFRATPAPDLGGFAAAGLEFLEAGHMTFWEVPEEWGRAVTSWLDRHGPGAASRVP
jgi:hypothetical protein